MSELVNLHVRPFDFVSFAGWQINIIHAELNGENAYIPRITAFTKFGTAADAEVVPMTYDSDRLFTTVEGAIDECMLAYQGIFGPMIARTIDIVNVDTEGNYTKEYSLNLEEYLQNSEIGESFDVLDIAKAAQVNAAEGDGLAITDAPRVLH